MRGSTPFLFVCVVSTACLLSLCQANYTHIQEARQKRQAPDADVRSLVDYNVCSVRLPGMKYTNRVTCDKREVKGYRLLIPCERYQCDFHKLTERKVDFELYVYMSSWLEGGGVYGGDWVHFRQKLSTVSYDQVTGHYVLSVNTPAYIRSNVHSTAPDCAGRRQADDGQIVCYFVGLPKFVSMTIAVPLIKRKVDPADPGAPILINELILSSGDGKSSFTVFIGRKVQFSFYDVFAKHDNSFMDYENPMEYDASRYIYDYNAQNKITNAETAKYQFEGALFSHPCLILSLTKDPTTKYYAGCVYVKGESDPSITNFFESETCLKNGGRVKVEFCAHAHWKLCTYQPVGEHCANWQAEDNIYYKRLMQKMNIPSAKTTTTTTTTITTTTTEKPTTTTTKTTTKKTTTTTTTEKTTPKATKELPQNTQTQTTTTASPMNNKVTPILNSDPETTEDKSKSTKTTPKTQTATKTDNENGNNEKNDGGKDKENDDIKGEKNGEKDDVNDGKTENKEKERNEEEENSKNGGNPKGNANNELKSKTGKNDQSHADVGDEDENKGANLTVYIAGGIVGFLVLLLVAVLLLIFFVRRRKPESESSRSDKEKEDATSFEHVKHSILDSTQLTAPHGPTENTGTYEDVAKPKKKLLTRAHGPTENTITYEDVLKPKKKKLKKGRGSTRKVGADGPAIGEEKSVKMFATPTPIDGW